MQLSLTNYQSWPACEVEIGEGITVIVGPTDSGKSAILRAFRDLAYGVRGIAGLRRGAKTFTVALTSEHGTVRLIKGAKKNRYEIALPGEDVKAFEGHGASVPKEVTAALGIREVEVDRGLSYRPQFSSQLGEDPLFVLGLPASSVAKILGSASGLHILLGAIRDKSAEEGRLTAAEKEASEKLVPIIDAITASEAEEGRINLCVFDAEALVTKETVMRVRASLSRTMAGGIRAILGRATLMRGKVVPDLAGVATKTTEAKKALDAAKSARAYAERISAGIVGAKNACAKIVPETVIAKASVDAARGHTEALLAKRAHTLEVAIGTLGSRAKDLSRKTTNATISVDLSAAQANIEKAEKVRAALQRITTIAASQSLQARRLKPLVEAVMNAEADLAAITVCPLCQSPITHTH